MINSKSITACAFLVCFAYMVRADASNGMSTSMKFSREFMEQCEKELGITTEEAHNSNKDSEKTQCFHKCIATKEGFISSEGVINIDQIKEVLILNPEKSKILDVIISCLETVGPINSCKDMSKMKECFDK